jgi:hypothetical protein
MLKSGEEIRQSWEERNREHFARIAANPSTPGYEAARIKPIQSRMQWEAKKR